MQISDVNAPSEVRTLFMYVLDQHEHADTAGDIQTLTVERIAF